MGKEYGRRRTRRRLKRCRIRKRGMESKRKRREEKWRGKT